MSELLPCPFCGASVELRHALGEYWGHCKPCEASGGSASNRDAAIAAWNRRSPAGDREQIAEGIDLQLVLDAPALIQANIESVPGWADNTALITAHCHAHVLKEDLPDLLAPALSQPRPEGEMREGWRAVPVEPTHEMICAGDGKDPGFGSRSAAIYRAMLAAAPSYFASLSPVDGGDEPSTASSETGVGVG